MVIKRSNVTNRMELLGAIEVLLELMPQYMATDIFGKSQEDYHFQARQSIERELSLELRDIRP